jgi:hypothetical protein
VGTGVGLGVADGTGVGVSVGVCVGTRVAEGDGTGLPATGVGPDWQPAKTKAASRRIALDRMVMRSRECRIRLMQNPAPTPAAVLPPV